MEKEKKDKEKIDHREYTKTLFLTHLVPLKRSQQNGSNYTLKEH
jgi:hypothetical protein